MISTDRRRGAAPTAGRRGRSTVPVTSTEPWKGSHEETKEEKDKDYLRRERRYGSFQRSMALPAGVDAKKIEAKTHDGVVEVVIPLPKVATKETVKITPTAT